MLVNAPQEIVFQFFLGWLLECLHPDALGVDPFEHTLDRPVLATSVRCLEHDQQALLALGVQSLLHLLDPVPNLLDLGLRRRLDFPPTCVVWVDLRKTEA
jgi:hypothetical protein